MGNELVPLTSTLSRTNIHVLLNSFTWHGSTSRVLRKIGVATVMRAQKSGASRIFLHSLVNVNKM
jgi:hypothetical protein